MQKDYFTKDRITVNNKKYDRWKKLMEIGERTGCHQIPERSLSICGYQFPVCARCTGVMIGYVAAVPLYFWLGFRRVAVAAGCLAMFTDWCVQRLKICESTNLRRMITGIVGGYGIMTTQLELLHKLKNLHKKTV